MKFSHLCKLSLVTICDIYGLSNHKLKTINSFTDNNNEIKPDMDCFTSVTKQLIHKLTGICEMFVMGSILSGQSMVASGIHKAQLM